MKLRKIVTSLLMLVVTVSCCTVSTYAAELPDQRAFSFMRATGHFDIVTLIFSIPGAIASQAVQWLIWGLGLTATVGPFVIPQGTILNCQKTSYHWRLQDDEDSNRYTMFTGDRYIITEKTAGKTEYKDDFFYVPASYRNRDNDYALEMFRLLYGSMKSVRVSAWKPA